MTLKATIHTNEHKTLRDTTRTLMNRWVSRYLSLTLTLYTEHSKEGLKGREMIQIASPPDLDRVRSNGGVQWCGFGGFDI